MVCSVVKLARLLLAPLFVVPAMQDKDIGGELTELGQMYLVAKGDSYEREGKGTKGLFIRCE